MSNAVSALQGKTGSGLAEYREIELQGMITLRADLGSAAVQKALRGALGFAMPGQRCYVSDKGRGCAWMSPDELLITLPHDKADAMVAELSQALKGQHHLVLNVSDARAVFEVSGEGARDVLAKLCPVDLSAQALAPGSIRRTRAAQVPVALLHHGDGRIWLICFRSVARYVFDLLAQSAQPGGVVGYY